MCVVVELLDKLFDKIFWLSERKNVSKSWGKLNIEKYKEKHTIV